MTASRRLSGRVRITILATGESFTIYSPHPAALYDFRTSSEERFGDTVRRMGIEAEINGTPRYDFSPVA